MSPRGRLVLRIALGTVLLGYLLCMPRNLFRGVPYSTVVVDRGGQLLGARIADDGQWRFPPSDTVPEKYAKALVRFEDKRFRYHPGVDLLSIGRAVRDNLREGRVTSGGSTITMQVIRLSRQRERTLWQKAVEAVLATRLELRYSKRKILALYASHAPFGGNVVGLEAASWRYFGRPPGELSWAESATLAVLPNAPSSIHPGRGREELLSKRNRLLENLLRHGEISPSVYEEAITEPLPEAPVPLPSHARHLVETQKKGVRTVLDIDLALQKRVEAVTDRFSDDLALSGAADMAAVVMELSGGGVVAYVGNTSPGRERTGSEVDIARSPRSTGSILKPFLYCSALQDGKILPETLLPDVPVNLGGFTPQNFDMQFHGAVPAAEALSRSLNVPAVHLLRMYGVPRFHQLLKDCGLTTLTMDASHYGLSLILGGAEGTLLDITRAYAGMVMQPRGFPLDDPVALWYTYEALGRVNRPDEIDWKLVPSVRKAAWKTGTSYGFRDAWAVGVTPDYAIGVWCGNADGHGVPALTGAKAAGPVLFALLNLLPEGEKWFPEPSGGIYADVCTDSGMLKSLECPTYKSVLLPAKAMETAVCPYHKGGSFVLPPAMEWYYKPYHPEYAPPVSASEVPLLEFIYPESGSVIYLPRQLDGSAGEAVFRIAHRDPGATVWWHLDGEYCGETRLVHEMGFAPAPGAHTLVAVDDKGNTAAVRFSVAEGSSR